jgi:imidazolonepropionase-like amidohydrolase
MSRRRRILCTALSAGFALFLAAAALQAQIEDQPQATTGEAGPDGARAAVPALVPTEARRYLLRGATVLTVSGEVLAPGDVLVEDGRIAAVAPSVEAPEDTVVLDVSGLYLSPGLIDGHSHSAVSGNVNEATNAVTAEVRIADILDPTDIALYRELAGGLTVANILHGSANPIGGQNAVIKLRYGALLPEDLLFAEAPPGIKLALGENVKQSNWGENLKRYPKTRMGVVEVMREAFQRAQAYRESWARHTEQQSSGLAEALPPKRDLQLEALVEVLEGKRLVHCHSYRADEILAMMRLAEELGFRIQTFQHALEAYRVADEIAEHGAGISIFTDWWSYKMEVYEAIPYTAALCWERGVLVSLNSDSDEMARRLNLEAAKAVKYGGVPENEALKMVTLNPAIQLGIDRYVGSIEVGKHADLALWSHHPLSSFAVCQMTFVDGRVYFDRQRDLAERPALLDEKKALQAEEAKAQATPSPTGAEPGEPEATPTPEPGAAATPQAAAAPAAEATPAPAAEATPAVGPAATPEALAQPAQGEPQPLAQEPAAPAAEAAAGSPPPESLQNPEQGAPEPAPSGPAAEPTPAPSGPTGGRS